ncbi:hypothetical protein HNR06_005347 [Nocardiopsis arvandica]|uniref:Uncharacterized protein n=1 Tax=Nocardiopsis sinuspersici TaxID=501010 RepID=A0A7Z0BLD7_9ACTN|nr:hypothetical protein [Nocardiopsis sinuspersici]NYH55758.1 hypothetical protein [Nocardiopsis sinuspersici]
MKATRLLGEDWYGASLQLVRDTFLVMVEGENDPNAFNYDFLAIAFDVTSHRPLGPVHSFDSLVRLSDFPSVGPEPVLAFTTRTSLMITDVRDGSVLRTFSLAHAGNRRYDECDLALGSSGGRDLLFLHQGGHGPYDHSVLAVDLATGEQVPEMGCDHNRYREISERLTLRHDYLAWPSTEEVTEFWTDDFVVFDKPFIYVQRADDGSWVGKVGLDDCVPEYRDVEIAHAAGRTYLAEAGNIVTLPDLKPVFPEEDPWVVVSRVTEWGGRPVAVLVQEQSHFQPSRRLCHLFLDTDTPEQIVIPWSVPPQVHDLLATSDGTIVVSSAEGVHILEIDPEGAARAGRPV